MYVFAIDFLDLTLSESAAIWTFVAKVNSK